MSTENKYTLLDYIVRAFGDELIDRWGETDESIAYAKISKSLAVYNDIR
jgi:hypothetical protein